MSATHFKCPDGETILIADCLWMGGCRMPQRCATRPFLRLVGFDRKWGGVTPSAAGNGPRYLYLKATTDYTIDPTSRVWAAIGTGTHGKLSIHKYTKDVLSEERMTDEEISGIPDVLEQDETKDGYFVLSDYKVFGSFKTAKVLGIKAETAEETMLGEDGKPILLKSGKNKGLPKTKQRRVITQDDKWIDIKSETLQLNRYRITFEGHGFPISRMQLQVMPRDGGTYVAQNRGIDKLLYLVPIKRLVNTDVMDYYRNLAAEVTEAFKTGYARKCNVWETWEGKRCEEKWCEVIGACREMSRKAGEKWGII